MSDRDAFREAADEHEAWMLEKSPNWAKPDRSVMEAARAAGLQKRQAKRLEAATYTAAEVKVLTEAALRLGRKEAFEEVFAEIDEDTPDCACEDCEVDRREFARRIRSLASLPQEAVSDAISVPSEGPGTSEPSKAAKTAQDAPGPGVGHRRCDCERGHPIDICAECGDDWPCEEAR